jgi:homospermidine synthase
MKTNKMENKMKTLNKKNLERINDLLSKIYSDRYLSKDIQNEKGSEFWLSLACSYDSKLNIIKLFEEFGICYELKETIERWISEKDEMQEENKKAWETYLRLSREKRTA